MALHVTELTSVGVVSEGDNPGAEIMFYKRKKDANAVSVEQTDRDDMTFDVSALPDEAQQHIAQIEKSANDAAAATIEALEAKVVELTPTEKVEEVEIGKASDEVQALIKSLRETADSQAEKLAVEVTKRRDTEFIAKVREAKLDALLGDATEIGPVLRELEDVAPEAFGKLYQPLLAATQRVELAKAFAEIGASEGDADPQSQKTAWIQKQKQDGSDKSDADLAVAFWAAHPDAVAKERESK